MARIYEYEIKWTKNHRTGRNRMAVYRMKNGKCVKRLTVKEMDGFAPRSPELYAYLDGLYKKTRWLNV